MEGFGVNTYMWVNESGQHCYIKYHWKPNAGLETITRQEATILAGTDPNIAKRNLYDTIENGIEVVYDLKVQIMMPDEVNCQGFNPFDATKVWSEEKYPLITVGRMILNENPKNSFVQVEQAAFCPSALITGIQASPDKLLQGRLFGYSDAQRYRVGTNYLQLPTNRPVVEIHNNQRDGEMQFKIHEGNVNYEPNSLANGYPKEAERDCAPPTIEVDGCIRRTQSRKLMIILRQENSIET